MCDRQFMFRVVVTACPVLVLAGCNRLDRPERQEVLGYVSIDGRPVASGRVVFRRTDGQRGMAVSAGVQDGLFELTRQDGPTPGQYTVEVELEPQLPFEIDDDVAFASHQAEMRVSSNNPWGESPGAATRLGEVEAAIVAGERNILDCVLRSATNEQRREPVRTR